MNITKGCGNKGSHRSQVEAEFGRPPLHVMRFLARWRRHLQQAVDELALPLQTFLARDLGREPLRAVDLRKARPAAALRRPFDLECVRLERRRIEVTLEREGGDDLAARLRDLAERPELTAWARPGLFL